jgi:hypothetical protein
MEEVIILAKELKKVKATVASLVAIPLPVVGDTGPQGLAGKEGKAGKDGKAGLAGSSGKAGKDGEDGKAGVFIVDAEVDIDGTLSFKMSDGSFIKTTTEVVGAKGEPGVRGIPGAKGDQLVKSGTAILDFGAGNTTAEVVVTGISHVSATTRAIATTRMEATADHPVDDLLVDPIRTVIKSLVVGEGFTIYGAMDNARANGLYKVDWFLSN